ncbi:glycosyltransferase family 8 protein [Lacticaseibacillus hulanensis]|uniref:glycosyltransferase family 8 protein n=1 Tax=Lacticaseibacillus hulanensis TaxID=2493111 RepID=UPI000FDCD7BA|nr:glycosyltransferase family 8 protein [Lacticaseibacillus hulanensis]
MINEAEAMPIFFAVDDHYAASLAVAVQSLIANSDPKKQYKVIVLNQGLQAANQERLKQLATDNVGVELLPMADQIKACLADDNNKLRADYFTLTIYYRLFIAEMFPQYDKGLYLDADVIVLDDIANLFATDVSDSLVAAACDPFIAKDKIMSQYAERSVGVPATDYVNSGVLVMNLAKMRQANFAGHFVDMLNKYKFNSIAPDQDYLNAIAHDQMVHLPLSWNVQEVAPSYDVKLVHYNLFKKPWHYVEVPNGDDFWIYAKQTPYADQLMQQREEFSEADAALDDKHMSNMVARAEIITDQPASFAKIQQATGEVRL